MFVYVKMSYDWFHRQEILEKAKNKYHNGGGKKEAAAYYIGNKDVLKEKARNKYSNLSEEEEMLKMNMDEIGTEIC